MENMWIETNDWGARWRFDVNDLWVFSSLFFCLSRRTILWAAGPRTKYPKGTRLVTGGASISWYIWTHRPLQNDTSSILIHQMLLWSGDGIFIFIPPPFFLRLYPIPKLFYSYNDRERKQTIRRSIIKYDLWNLLIPSYFIVFIWLFIFLWFYRLFSCLGRI